MTAVPPPAIRGWDRGRSGWANPPHKRRRRHQAGITGVLVAAGFAGASLALPPDNTPAGVTEAYLAARLDGDWSQAWSLLCREVVTGTHFTTWADDMAYRNDYFHMPEEADIDVGRAVVVPGWSGPQVVVPVTLTRDDDMGIYQNWSREYGVLLVQEEGEFRVCDDRRAPLTG